MDPDFLAFQAAVQPPGSSSRSNARGRDARVARSAEFQA